MNRRSLTEELKELQGEKEAEGEEDEEIETSLSPPSCQSKCGNARSAQVSEEQGAPLEQPRSTDTGSENLSKETASVSKKEDETCPRISLLALRSQDDADGDGLVPNQVRSRVA